MIKDSVLMILHLITKLVSKILALPGFILFGILNVMVSEIGSVLMFVGGLTAKLVVILIILALFTKQWLALALLCGILAIWGFFVLTGSFIVAYLRLKFEIYTKRLLS